MALTQCKKNTASIRLKRPAFGFIKKVFLLWLALCFLQVASALEEEDLYDLSLFELSQIEVSIASGVQQTLIEAPAIVSVISAQDIAFWGFKSVAEAINTQPGIYCIYDGLSPNCGVRSVNGGLRGYSKILKVMINGQVIAFKSDSTNYLGPELISMQSIDHIEIVRGPGSALYGANAFLGVVNIITKTHQPALPSQFHGVISEDGYGLSAQYQQQNATRGVLLSVYRGGLDRSGSQVPDELPSRSLFTPGDKTVDDFSYPFNVFMQGYQNIPHQAFKLNGHFSRLDRRVNFVDFGRFSETGELGENVRISLDSWFVQGIHEWQIHPHIELKTSLSVSEGKPSDKEKLDLGLSNSFSLRDFGFEAVDAQVQSHWVVNDSTQLTLGLDHSEDNEKLIENYEVNTLTLEKTRRSFPQDHKKFINSGLYAQYYQQLNSQLAITLNGRLDEHNIYGENSNTRLAGVYNFSNTLSSKFIYSTSYKAPAAIQLYGQPLFDGEVTGNKDLIPETASSIEFQLNWNPSGHTSLAINLYQMTVEDQVELILIGSNQTPINQNTQHSVGLELEWKYWLSDHKFSANLSLQDTDVDSLDLIGQPITVENDLYPDTMLNGFWQYHLLPNTGLGLHGRYLSNRRASKSNVDLNGGNDYQLDGYWLLNMNITHNYDHHEVNLVVENVFDTEYTEPGFSGLDLPGRSRAVILNIKLAL